MNGMINGIGFTGFGIQADFFWSINFERFHLVFSGDKHKVKQAWKQQNASYNQNFFKQRIHGCANVISR